MASHARPRLNMPAWVTEGDAIVNKCSRPFGSARAIEFLSDRPDGLRSRPNVHQFPSDAGHHEQHQSLLHRSHSDRSFAQQNTLAKRLSPAKSSTNLPRCAVMTTCSNVKNRLKAGAPALLGLPAGMPPSRGSSRRNRRAGAPRRGSFLISFARQSTNAPIAIS